MIVKGGFVHVAFALIKRITIIGVANIHTQAVAASIALNALFILMFFLLLHLCFLHYTIINVSEGKK